jgi:hypothetical protein
VRTLDALAHLVEIRAAVDGAYADRFADEARRLFVAELAANMSGGAPAPIRLTVVGQIPIDVTIAPDSTGSTLLVPAPRRPPRPC